MSVPLTSPRLAKNINLAATPRNPDQQTGHSVDTTETEATQPTQILSDTRIVIKINFPGRQHQPTHPKKRGGKGQVGVTAKKIKQLLNRGTVCMAAQASHTRDVWSVKNTLLHQGESFAALGR